jgi:hypothetical protein
METYLFDIIADPFQNSPAKSPEIEAMLENLMVETLKENDGPQEVYELYHLPVA